MKLSSHEMQDVNCSIIEKYKEMHAKLENKTARSVKEELRVHVTSVSRLNKAEALINSQ
jgi:hypothetical protein